MSLDLKDVHIDKSAVSAIKHLIKYDNISTILLDQIETRIFVETFADDFPTYENLGLMIEARANELEQSCADAFFQSHGSKMKSQDLMNRINLIRNEIRGCILLLDDYIQGNIIPKVDSEWAQNEATQILDKLKTMGGILEEMTDQAEEELDDINDVLESVLVKIFNSTVVSKLKGKMNDMRDRLDDLMQYISQANKNSDEVCKLYYKILLNHLK